MKKSKEQIEKESLKEIDKKEKRKEEINSGRPYSSPYDYYENNLDKLANKIKITSDYILKYEVMVNGVEDARNELFKFKDNIDQSQENFDRLELRYFRLNSHLPSTCTRFSIESEKTHLRILNGYVDKIKEKSIHLIK